MKRQIGGPFCRQSEIQVLAPEKQKRSNTDESTAVVEQATPLDPGDIGVVVWITRLPATKRKPEISPYERLSSGPCGAPIA